MLSCAIHGRAPKKLLVLGPRIRDEIANGAGFGWTIVQARSISQGKGDRGQFIHAQWRKRPVVSPLPLPKGSAFRSQGDFATSMAISKPS
jgi:hypothetical protein